MNWLSNFDFAFNDAELVLMIVRVSLNLTKVMADFIQLLRIRSPTPRIVFDPRGTENYLRGVGRKGRSCRVGVAPTVWCFFRYLREWRYEMTSANCSMVRASRR
jgi:hypothetical protein